MSLFRRSKPAPPPPPPAPEPERRVHFAKPDPIVPDEDDTITAPAKKARQSNAVSKRPRELIIHDVAANSDLVRPTSEPSSRVINGDEIQSESASNVLTLDTYPMMQNYLVTSIMRSADFEQSGSDAAARDVKKALMQAEQRQVGVNTAAHLNYMLRVVEGQRAQHTNANGVAILQEPPYSDASVSAFSANFVGSAIECAPSANAHEHMPSDELRAASRGVEYEYMTTFMRSAHPGEYACASREECVGMRLLDSQGTKLPPTIWKVFWFENELRAVLDDPQKYAAEAKCRYCIGCKIFKANKCFVNVVARNNRVLPDTLMADFHVLVNVPGQFPNCATIGHGVDGYYGLAQNMPRFSYVGWTAQPDGQRANCFIYRWDIPCYPIPRSWYERHAGRTSGF